MHTPLTSLLQIQHPILLAPMGSVSGGALAAAVSGAGGLGMIGAGYGDADWLRRELAAAGDARVGVGFITWSLAQQPALLELALAHAPAAVMFSFGDFGSYLEQVRAAGAKVICQVQTVADARCAADAGADVIVAQGTEAGGHGAERGTFALVPAVVDAVSPLPVVAAGGVADGRGLAAALLLGASGVLVGTRFFATEEALGHPAAKQAIVDAAGDDTVRTRVFDIVRGYPWPAPYTGRALRNSFLAAWHGREDKLEHAVEAERARYWQAAAAGDVDTAVVFAGDAVDCIASIEPAARVVQQLAAEAGRLLKGAADLVG